MSPYRDLPRATTPHGAAALMRAASVCARILLGLGIGYLLPSLPACSGSSPPPAGYPGPEALAQYALTQQTCVSAASTRVSAEECLTATRVAFCASYPGLAMCHATQDGGPDGH